MPDSVTFGLLKQLKMVQLRDVFALCHSDYVHFKSVTF